ncbi:hypothetical protein ACTHQY_09060 [Rhodococcoides corynebacterioides]|uniref:hypothetical protein n=1 Tax=Rhodococcoides corynebacterioides TaxID=53972 RepID=UPI003F7F718A
MMKQPCTRADCIRPARSRGLCHACYMRYLDRQKAYGRFESLYVDAEPARAHVRALIAAGLSQRRITDLAGLNRKALTTLLHGRPERGTGPSRRITKANADSILAVPIPRRPDQLAAPGDNVDATGATRRLRALVASGWSGNRLVAELDGAVSHCTVYGLLRGERALCAASTARHVAALFDRLQMQPGPSNWARRHARDRGWPLPLEWDEDEIDIPSKSPVQVDREAERAERRRIRDERITRVQTLTAMGLSAESIAGRIGVSYRTVERDRRAIAC